MKFGDPRIYLSIGFQALVAVCFAIFNRDRKELAVKEYVGRHCLSFFRQFTVSHYPSLKIFALPADVGIFSVIAEIEECAHASRLMDRCKFNPQRPASKISNPLRALNLSSPHNMPTGIKTRVIRTRSPKSLNGSRPRSQTRPKIGSHCGVHRRFQPQESSR
jgi:hypothetical protein